MNLMAKTTNAKRVSKLLSIFSLLSACLIGCSTAPISANAETVASNKENIYNYIAYSDAFASAGQPTEEQLSDVADAGVERVVYLAFSDQERSLPAEDRVVKNLGMSYLQIPVDWKAPQPREYYLFASAMRIEPERKTLLHCQANLRASAFAFLYRVLELEVPLKEAKSDLNEIWIPNGVWTQFVLDVLTENNVDPNCNSCDWTPSSIGD